MVLNNLDIPFEPWIVLYPISFDYCFLCGTELRETNRTTEHVFPRWLQREFRLSDQPLTLPNKTWIPYRQVGIPCCQECNNTHLSRLEEEIATGVRAGYDSFIHNVPKLQIFQWLQCIMYKVLYRDLELKVDRSDPRSHSTTSQLDLVALRLSHLFLRSIDKNVLFRDFFPASIYVVRVKTSPNPALNFDYVDSVPDQCLAIRMNDIGIIGILRDGNLHEQLVGPQILTGILDKTYNPVQFRNLFAKCLYPQILFNDPFECVVHIVDDDTVEIDQRLCEERSLANIFVYPPGNQEHYGEVLAQILGTTPDLLRLPDRSIGSLLFDRKGNWKDRSFDDDGVLRQEIETIQQTDLANKQ